VGARGGVKCKSQAGQLQLVRSECLVLGHVCRVDNSRTTPADEGTMKE